MSDKETWTEENGNFVGGMTKRGWAWEYSKCIIYLHKTVKEKNKNQNKWVRQYILSFNVATILYILSHTLQVVYQHSQLMNHWRSSFKTILGN